MPLIDAKAGGRQQLLGTIFGADLPKDGAAAVALLEASPLRPKSKTELAALRELVLLHVGERVDGLRAAARELTQDGAPRTVQHRPLGDVLALQIEQATRASGKDAPRLKRAVSEAEALELYRLMANAPDIPHGFVDDGCHFRAHVIAKRLEEAGVYCEKAFHRPTRGDLRIDTDKAAIGFTLGMFHAATCIFVKTAGGNIERRIIDPSLCDRPATLAEWTRSMSAVGGAPCETVFAARFVLMPWQRNQEAPTAWVAEDLKDAREWNDVYKKVQEDLMKPGPDGRNFYDELRELVAHPPGA